MFSETFHWICQPMPRSFCDFIFNKRDNLKMWCQQIAKSFRSWVLFFFFFFAVHICTKKDGSCVTVLYSPTWAWRRRAAFSTLPTLIWPSALRRMEFTHLLNSAEQKSRKFVTKCCGGEVAVGKGTIVQGRPVKGHTHAWHKLCRTNSDGEK